MSHTPSPPLNHLFNFDITHRKLKNKSHNFKEQTHSNSHERSRISLDEADFECILCFRLYYQPVTLICGHTFCKNCILSSLKTKKECPLCREKLFDNKSEFKISVSYVLVNFLEKHFNKEYNERALEEKDVNISLFDDVSTKTQEPDIPWHINISHSLISFYTCNMLN